MEQNKLIIGMPAGSLANASRGGNLIKLLDDSGFRTSGYETGGPSVFTTVNFLYGWDGRPQEFSSQLAINELDIAIAGDDWIKERILELELEYNTKVELERVMPLNRGDVRIVGIIDDSLPFTTPEDYLKDIVSKKDLLVVVSEMPYLALDWVRSKLEKIGKLNHYKEYSVQKYKTPSKIKKGVIIYETWGKTEAKVKNKGADFGVEITQTGSALKSYNLKIVETIMSSQTSIWINPKIKQDAVKKELMKILLLNIYGTINAEHKVLLAFNVKNEHREQIEKYLQENNLFADEPTMTSGKAYTVYNIQVDTRDCKVPLAIVRYELAKRFATNINTMPIQSSIPMIDSIVM